MSDESKKKLPATPVAATADQLIRELRALAEKRGWVASSSSVDQEGSVTVTARPKTDDE